MNKPWSQTEGGNVGVDGKIDMQTNTPPTGEDNAENLVIYDNPRDHFTSAKGWLVSSYTFHTTSLEDSSDIYDDLLNIYQSRGVTSVTLDDANTVTADISTAAAGSNNILVQSGTPTNVIINDTTPYSGKPIVVFIPGNLQINRNTNIDNDTGIVYVVGGNLRILGSAVATDIDGFFIVNQATSTGVIPNQQLTVNGGIVSFGNNSSTAFTFERDLGATNRTEPAERFIFQPRYLWLLKDLAGVSPKAFEELTP